MSSFCHRLTRTIFHGSLSARTNLVQLCLSTVLLPATLTPVTVTAFSTMPSPPLRYELPGASLDLTDLANTVSALEEKRQEAYDLSRRMHVGIVKLRHSIDNNEKDPETKDKVDSILASVSPKKDGSNSDRRTPRLANLSNRMEDYVRLQAYQHFLQTGHLLAPSACPWATDEEYLAGSCMGLAQDLQRYGLGRATARDVDSVQAAANLVSDIMDYLLEFDFRNGPLRRRYDGTKYALKGLETLLYELAVTGSEGGEEQRSNKRQKKESLLLPTEELNAVRERMVHRDELRESLIKKCRDGQKAAKQSIFALHRGDKDRAVQLLEQCHTCIVEQLIPIVQEEPPLRMGSFANVLEEYVEAKLFASWMYGKDVIENPTSSPSGLILKPQEFDIELQPEEYFGGLCDLTGEVGRFAVQRGTARDVDGVKLCLQTNSNILTALQTMERLPSGIGKKMDQLRRSVEKLERMLYEMSLSQAAGGRNVHSDIDIVEDGET